MGIINLAPDSFSSQGRCETAADAVSHALDLIEAGADILDIGAEPTNPKIKAFNSLETQMLSELERLLPVIAGIRTHSDIPLSVDTSEPKVMQAVIEAGANLINDVRALSRPNALTTAAQLDVPVCLMHMTFPDGNIQPHKTDPNLSNVVLNFLKIRIQAALDAGIKPEHIIIDPGFGGGSFGKNTVENCELFKSIPKLKAQGFPVLIGLSRKKFIGDILDAPESERIYASLALNLYAIEQGASIIRTHDVKALQDALRILALVSA